MTTKKERYLALKHKMLENCGQCLGFRARGISLEQPPEGHTCNPGTTCHLNCSALGTAKSIESVGAPAVEEVEVKGKNYITQSCMKCGNTEDQAVLLPCRTQGESKWVCTRCLPAMIHG